MPNLAATLPADGGSRLGAGEVLRRAPLGVVRVEGPGARCARPRSCRSCSRASCAATTRRARSTSGVRGAGGVEPRRAAARRRAGDDRRACPTCVGGASAGRIEVLVDGGVRWGTDVLRALALGARAVLLGRPILWGLAVGGEEGVRGVLEIVRAELSRAMALAGCSKRERNRPRSRAPGRVTKRARRKRCYDSAACRSFAAAAVASSSTSLRRRRRRLRRLRRVADAVGGPGLRRRSGTTTSRPSAARPTTPSSSNQRRPSLTRGRQRASRVRRSSSRSGSR